MGRCPVKFVCPAASKRDYCCLPCSHTQLAPALLVRLGMLPSMRNSHVSHWASSVAKVSASSGAKKMKESARLKSLHRTPYPMVLSRMKLLLDRLQVLKHVGLQSARSEFGIHHGVSIKSRDMLLKGGRVVSEPHPTHLSQYDEAYATRDCH
eukprot:scaffold117715_cov17-Tisochrysis_lutea.AAC.1